MSHQIGFNHAWEGIKYAFSTQPNFRVHGLLATIALLLGVWLGLNSLEWLVLVFTICMVLIAEMVNTALESMTDLIEEKYHVKAKIAKDVSAGMVLVSAISSLIVGLIIFVPKLWRCC